VHAVVPEDDHLPDVAPAEEDQHSTHFRVQDPVFQNAGAEILLPLLDVIAVLSALADDLDDDLGNPTLPDPGARRPGPEVDGLVRVAIGLHPGQAESTFRAPGPELDDAPVGDSIKDE